MSIKGFTTSMVIAGLMTSSAVAQQLMSMPGGAAGANRTIENWEVRVREMKPEVREKITNAWDDIASSGEDRSIIGDVLTSVSSGLVSGLVDVVVSETYNLAQYRKKQKQEWMKMIQNEDNYTDSITSIKGLNDFYKTTSKRGALDPSDINFDGIEIRGMRDDQCVIYMTCSIDRDKIDHMIHHSKFNLLLDTLAFYPYQCHLPNVTANGIRTMKNIKKGKSVAESDSIVRPGGNGFSFDERNNLCISIDFSVYSSWITQSTQVFKNIELGNFSFNIKVPENEVIKNHGVYTYSYNDIVSRAKLLPEDQRELYLENNLIAVDGDCFVVPRSYMPLGNNKSMWGTGEYNIKVKVRESCQFADKSEKAKQWRKDYKRLRQMQNKSSQVKEYFQTLWNQNGSSLVKTLYKTAVSTAATDIFGTGSSVGGAAGVAAASGAAAAEMPGM